MTPPMNATKTHLNPNFPGVSPAFAEATAGRQSGAAGTPPTQTGSPKGELRGSERVKRPTHNANIVGRSPRRTPTQSPNQ